MSVLPFKEDADFEAHNSAALKTAEVELREFVADYESHQSAIDDARRDQKDLITVMKAVGYDVKALRELLKRRKQDAGAREELEATVQLYMDLLRG
jgi:uncharacterized protein (UPF0335 family)